MPYTPSALKVFRSAWIPAPPPESEPAIESARGLGASMRSRLPALEVIPAGRLERRLDAVGAHGGHVHPVYDLADLRQRDAEPLAQLRASPLHRVPQHGYEELVVLAPREREAQRIDAQHPTLRSERGGGRHIGGPDPRPDP